jgi:hypothetical protein
MIIVEGITLSLIFTYEARPARRSVGDNVPEFRQGKSRKLPVNVYAGIM